MPLRYGLVALNKTMSYKLLTTLPAGILRQVFLERATADVTVTPDYVMNAASRLEVDPGLSYLDCVKQLVPMWLLRPQSLTDQQRDIVARGIRFAEEFLGQRIALQLPTRERMECSSLETQRGVHGFLVDVLRLREEHGSSWEDFSERARQLITSLGEEKKQVVSCLRAMIGQKQGAVASRLLFLLPLDYLQSLEYVLHLRLEGGAEALPAITRLAA